MRVEPPTMTIWSMSATEMPASLMTVANGALVRLSRSAVSSSNLARLRVSSRCIGPSLPAVM